MFLFWLILASALSALGIRLMYWGNKHVEREVIKVGLTLVAGSLLIWVPLVAYSIATSITVTIK